MTLPVSEQKHTPVVDLPNALVRLRKWKTPGVLSAYLDVSPTRIERQAYLLAFRDGCRTVRRQIPNPERNAFEEAAACIERFLTTDSVSECAGLAVFAGSSRECVAVALPGPPVEHVIWGSQPELAPLEAALDDYERLAVVLFDTEQARLFTIFLGHIESQVDLRDYVPRKQATGGWYGLQQTSFERHREDHLRRHADRTVRALMDMLRAHSFDRLLLGGPEEPVAVLRHSLPRPLRARLSGSVDVELFASDADVLRASLRAAEAIERRDEQELVTELLDHACTPHVVFGTAATLNALAEGRVHQLLISDSFAEPGAQCSVCGRLVRDAHACPDCGADTKPVSNLRENAVRQALAQAARVEFVDGSAADRLDEYGGIGAWTRF